MASEQPSDKRRMRLDFLGIGTQKGGTTSLNAYLRQHERIDLPNRELHCFDDEALDWPHPDFDPYHSHFTHPVSLPVNGGPEASPGTVRFRLLGEITPIYMYWEPCAERIYNYNPAIKLIILLRNPLARAYSHWAMEKERGLEHLSFSEALRQEPLRCQAGSPGQHRVYSYLDRGRYAFQIRRLFRWFTRSQMLILRSEELFHAPTVTLRRLTDFLQIPPFAELIPTHSRRGVYPDVLRQDDWEFMATALEEDIRDLEDQLGWDCEAWRRPWAPFT